MDLALFGSIAVRWGIRNQILWPFAVVLLAAVALTAAAAAWMAAERSEREIADRQARVLQTLGRTNFPWSQNVLEMMRGLSGAEFVVWDGGDEPMASTLPSSSKLGAGIREQVPFDVADVSERQLVTVGDRRYFAAGLRRLSPRGVEQSLIALFPEDQLISARREAALPPLVVGGMTLVAMAIVAAWLASRIGRRIRIVQQQVALIAGGDFREMPMGTTRDEIFALVQSVNQMAARLRGFQETIERTERSRLLGQLAGGLAHQLRNAVTGARLAIQLHQRRCDTDGDRETLDVALRQLEITEEHVKSLLSVGKRERREPQPRSLANVLDDVAALVSPVCRHENIAFSLDPTCAGGVSPPHQTPPNARCHGSSNSTDVSGPLSKGKIDAGDTGATRPRHTHLADFVVGDSEAVRTAVLNLVLNAVDAAGPNGEIAVRVGCDDQFATIDVLDNGPGPPKELKQRLFEPFVTGKPEGVGLGLALVHQIASELGGSVSWERYDARTSFRFTTPIENCNAGETGTPDSARFAGIPMTSR